MTTIQINWIHFSCSTFAHLDRIFLKLGSVILKIFKFSMEKHTSKLVGWVFFALEKIA